MTPKKGDRIERLKEPGTRKEIPKGAIGTVTCVYNGEFDVEYSWFAEGQTKHRSATHNVEYENRSWRFADAAVTFAMEAGVYTQGEQVFIKTAAETIQGVVPQVKYEGTIIWQGDPVPAEKDGEKVTLDIQMCQAQQVASDKINEVVKGLFA